MGKERPVWILAQGAEPGSAADLTPPRVVHFPL